MRKNIQNSLVEVLIRVAGIKAEPILQSQKLEMKKGEAELSTYLSMGCPLIFTRTVLQFSEAFYLFFYHLFSEFIVYLRALSYMKILLCISSLSILFFSQSQFRTKLLYCGVKMFYSQVIISYFQPRVNVMSSDIRMCKNEDYTMILYNISLNIIYFTKSNLSSSYIVQLQAHHRTLRPFQSACLQRCLLNDLQLFH